MEIKEIDREKGQIYQELQELGLNKAESRYDVIKAYSFIGQCRNKNTNLSLLVFDMGKRYSKDEKVEKIRKMFPIGAIVGEMQSKLKIPRKYIKEYIEEISGFFSCIEGFDKDLEKIVIEVGNSGLTRIKAKEKIDELRQRYREGAGVC